MSEVRIAYLGTWRVVSWTWSNTPASAGCLERNHEYRIAKTIDIIPYETCKLSLMPHEKKISLFTMDH